MKRVILAAILATSAGAARAAEVEIARLDAGQERVAGLTFQVSERFDRAWAVVHRQETAPCGDECTVDDPLPVHVAGLRFDAASGQVVLEDGAASPVVCAVVRHRSSRGTTEASATGACTLRTRTEQALVDDGFGGHQERHTVVLLGAAGAR